MSDLQARVLIKKSQEIEKLQAENKELEQSITLFQECEIEYDKTQIENKALRQKRNELYKEFRSWRITDDLMLSDRMLELLESFKVETHEMNGCDHKFVDSNVCLKCGWNPKEGETK